MHAVFVCFRNPLNYDTDYGIFSMLIRSFNACVYTRVCLYLFCKTEWLPFSDGGGGGFYENLAATLYDKPLSGKWS